MSKYILGHYNMDKRGTKWTPETHEQFINLHNSGKSKEQIAEILGRTSLSIEFRLKTHAANLYKSGSSPESIQKVTGLSEAEVTEICAIQALTEAATRKSQRWTEQEIIALLQALRRKKPLTVIAAMCQRTVGSIKSKIESLAYTYYHTDKKSADEISQLLNLPIAEIEQIAAKIKVTKSNKNEIA